MNVTVSRCLHRKFGEVYLNYTVDRSTTTKEPISISACLPGIRKPSIFQCENTTIPGLIQIVFKGGCEDPVVIVNETATVTLTVDVMYMDIMCNRILIGPQREYLCSAYVCCYR